MHRDKPFNDRILPLCRPLIEAIGNRMAFEAAKEMPTNGQVLSLFEMFCMQPHLDWYVSEGLVEYDSFGASFSQTCNALLPSMLQLLSESDIKAYIYAPIVSEKLWEQFVSRMPYYGGSSKGAQARKHKL